MSSSENSKEKSISSKSYEKLARLYNVIRYETECGNRLPAMKKILELEGDINYQVPESSCFKFHNPEHNPNIVGNTVLHFVAHRGEKGLNVVMALKWDVGAQTCDSKAAELLTSHGANPAIKNQQGYTAIHQIIRSIYRDKLKSTDPCMIQGKLNVPFIDILLAAHIHQKNSTNPRDPHGVSHFHAACIMNNTETVEFFLNNQVPIDEAVNVNSPMFPGYTPLHFAIRLGCVEVANILLSRGANLLVKDSEGMTALHLAIERYMRISQFIHLYRPEDYVISNFKIMNEEKLLGQIENVENIITSILSKLDKATIDKLHLLPFYIMYTLKDALFMGHDINTTVNMDSPFWPGYSALHFATRLNVESFKVLLKNGANIEAKDANGDTPFDLCVGTYEIGDIYEIFCCNVKWQEILLSDGKTKLSDLLRAMRDFSELKSYIVDNIQDINTVCIPVESPLWPGSTILHLAVILSKKWVDNSENFHSFNLSEDKPNELIQVCLNFGADVTVQDVYGSTPVHLAIRRLHIENTYWLLDNQKQNSNPVDKDNLSHLHIACAMRNERIVRKLMHNVNGAVSSGFKCQGHVEIPLTFQRKQFINISAGSTALHIAVIVNHPTIAKLLMVAGANIDARDVNGLTALHLLFMNTTSRNGISEILLSPLVSKDGIADGLNYLHVAAYGSCVKAIEKFIELGSDVNSAILAGSSFKKFEGNTPLHTAVYNVWSKDAAIPLMTHGANVLAKNSKGETPICGILMEDHLLRHFLSVMNDDVEKRLIDEMGVTKLHMACKLYDEEMIQDCVKNGANVNAQIHSDSKIWPGYTSLHVIVGCYTSSHPDKEVCVWISKFLLKNGADVTIADVRGETPLLINVYSMHASDDWRPPHMEILMKSLKTTSVNPTSLEGISHFHVACLRNDVGLVEKFLKLGVDVNQTVDYFTEILSGYTPLHFASGRTCNWIRSDLPPLRTIHLLLKYGANVHARDLFDNTPLHIAAQYKSCFHLPYKRILWAGADPKAKNYGDMVPLDDLCNKHVYHWFNSYFCGFGIRRRMYIPWNARDEWH